MVSYTYIRSGCLIVLKTMRFGALLAAPLLAACDAKVPSRSASQSGETPVASAPVDWSTVKPAGDGEAILAYKTLARACDAWHRGGKPRITLRHDGRSVATDDAGNTTPVSPQDWLAIIGLVRDSGKPTVAVASKSRHYAGGGPGTDNFGLLPRFKYVIELVDDNTLVFRNDGLYDDGK